MNFEPYKIKVVEPIPITKREDRLKYIKEAHYNVFFLPSSVVTIDLLTDSGTSALSKYQLSAMMLGDESYAGAESYYKFEEAVRKYTTKLQVIPVHQGRAGERIITISLLKKGDIVISNTLFDTTRANFEFGGAIIYDIPEEHDIESEYPFKGNIDLNKLEDLLKKHRDRVRFVVLTITNNSGGGQAVSIENVRETKFLCSKYGVKLLIDACRVSENSYLLKLRDKNYSNKSILEIVNETLSYADIITFSAKKDGLNHIGGFIALDDRELAEEFRSYLVLFEGFPTYGGMAGRDLEIISVGLFEGIDENYLSHRINQVKFLVESLCKINIPVMRPFGGHAIYVEAKRFLEHIDESEFPGQSLVVALYIEGGIRAVEVGKFMFKDARYNFVRLAIPRRVYTKSHLEYVVDIFNLIKEKRHKIKGMKIVKESRFLRHFRSYLEPVENWTNEL
ncbi:MAG: tryptophanase [candidate division WOR-3 bacterium]|nr:tryptophanase [candidate division WOR-3 bacterium]